MLYSRLGKYPAPLPDGDLGVNADGEVWYFQPLAGHPDSIKSCGYVPAPPEPAYDSISQQLVWTGSTWSVQDRPAAEVEQRREENKAQTLALFNEQVNAALVRRFDIGYAPAHPDFGGQRLQNRNADDKANWTLSLIEYSGAVQAGLGSMEGAEFRTMENNNVMLSYADGLDVLKRFLSWGKANYTRSWTLKNNFAANLEDGGKRDVDTESGWPS